LTTRESAAAEPRRGQYRFGDCVLDLERGSLRRSDEEVPLRPKAFEVLKYLVLHYGKLVSKNELVDAVWPDTAVTDNSLSQCLFEIRRALNDDAQAIIKTVARRGYLFDAPVSSVFVDSHRTPSDIGSGPRPVTEVRPASHRRYWKSGVTLAVIAVAAALGYIGWTSRERPLSLTYTQLTDFTDSAVAPALSPDGRMLAFIRSDSSFLTPDQIWVKLLPNGNPAQLTNLRGNKYGPSFSSDGSRIAFTVASPNPDWETFTVSAVGGDTPQLMLRNAAGLTWIDPDHVLFSEIRTGMHMGIVTSRPNRSERREVYFPQHERAMAHYSYVSPDRRSVLIVEMIDISKWLPCRLVSFNGGSSGRQVGPEGACTAAGWSPDGRWMYFSVEVDGHRHLWRQRFPDGQPEQITFGANEEDGVAIFPDGSLVTSVGFTESAVWIRDHTGERPVTSTGTTSPSGIQGMASRPVFSADGRYLYYLLRRESFGSATELWRYRLETNQHEAVVTGFAITDYDIERDGDEVVFAAQPAGKPSEIWVARLNRNASPHRISASGDASPFFGSSGEILFRLSNGTANYVARMERDGSGRRTVSQHRISTLLGISGDKRWLIVFAPKPDVPEDLMASFAVPVAGGPLKPMCAGFCIPRFSPDGRRLYLPITPPPGSQSGRTAVIPIPEGQALPASPGAEGFSGAPDVERIAGAQVIDGGAYTADYRITGLSPSSDPATFAYVKAHVHHNLFRIDLH
jgi:DNA-binding winged helix-turn-helix (wHTH) protein/Tol biopolymer transport system component